MLPSNYLELDKKLTHPKPGWTGESMIVRSVKQSPGGREGAIMVRQTRSALRWPEPLDKDASRSLQAFFVLRLALPTLQPPPAPAEPRRAALHSRSAARGERVSACGELGSVGL